MQTKKWRIKVAALCLCLGIGSTCLGKVIYVDDDATGANDGTSWENAYYYLQDALTFAVAGDEVRVAQGIYRPDDFVLSLRPNLGRAETFQLVGGVTLKGGYAGLGRPDPNARDVSLYKTILSGDLNSDDAAVARAADLPAEPTRAENSYHVVTTTYQTDAALAVLDGVVIAGGNANGEAYMWRSGAGVKASAETELGDCVIEGNSALDFGGGCESVGRFSRCTVRNNYAPYGGGLYGAGEMKDCLIEQNEAFVGGGVAHPQDASIWWDCVIRENSAATGGAVAITNERLVMVRCVLSGNRATGAGGAVHIFNDCTCWSELQMYQCRVWGNAADTLGGGVYQQGNARLFLWSSMLWANEAAYDGAGMYCNPYESMAGQGYISVVNCTIAGNTAGKMGGGVFCELAGRDWLDLLNNIIWGNSDESGAAIEGAQVRFAQGHGGTGTGAIAQSATDGTGEGGIGYCCIQGWTGQLGGEGNTGADPLFVDADGADDVPGNADDDLHLQSESSLIDAGSPAPYGTGTQTTSPDDCNTWWDISDGACRLNLVDLDGNPRVSEGMVDMGAYEYQQRATKVIYVDADASGAEDGSSWADAFMYLQDALRVATGSDRILVAEGVYRPDQGIYQPPCERTATFQLISGVTIQGGYAGLGQPDPNARDIELYETILSGDLRGNDPEFDSSEWQGIFDFTSDPNRAENSYSVVTGSGTDGAAVLDGFTITGGNANGPILGRCPDIDYRLAAGAGMYNARGSPTVLNCTFRRNTTRSPYGCSGSGCPAEADAQALAAAGGFYCSCASFTTYLPATCGAGMFNCSGSPTLQNCRFEENISYGADAFSAGGGMFNLDSNPALTNCIFTRNLVTGFDNEYYGGAVYDHSSTSTFTNCSFINNDSHQGGALYSGQESAATISNCLFVGNSAQHGSSAIHSSGIRLDVAGSTFAGNRGASWGGGFTIDCDHWRNTSLKVVNCILWNGGNEVSSDLSDVEITFSDIEGGWEGRGNINVDPRFAQPGRWDDNGTPDTDHDDFWVNGDYHLKSQAGRWNASEERWTIDEATSPCIDAGDPLSPIGLEPFPNGGIINMGAYGGTAEASKSYFGAPPCETIIAGDINGDCKVDFKDFAIMALHWLEDINQ